MRRGGGRKVRSLPRKFVFPEFCRDVPDPGKIRAHLSFPITVFIGCLLSMKSQRASWVHCKRRGSEKSTFLANIWGASILSGVHVL